MLFIFGRNQNKGKRKSNLSKWEKKRKKEKLAAAKAVKKRLKNSNIKHLQSDDLYTAAIGFYEGQKFKESEPFFAELYYRERKGENYFKNDDQNNGKRSDWWQKATELYYYGYDGVVRDMEKAGYLRMRALEKDVNAPLTELSILGVCVSLEKTVVQKDRQQLMTIDRNGMINILNTRFRYYLNIIADHPYNPSEGILQEEKIDTWFFFYELLLLTDAVRGLDDLGYWQAPRTAEAVASLFRDAAEKGDATAMFWLVMCAEAKIISMGEDEVRKWCECAAKKGNRSAIDLYVRRYYGGMSGREAEFYKKTLLQMKNDMLMPLSNKYSKQS